MSAVGNELFVGVVPFVVTAETRSFRKAAAQLGLTPSAISKAITRLETELGAQLFNRTSRSVTLTEQGEIFLRSCSEAVLNVRAARERLRDVERAPRGTLGLSLPLIYGKKLVLPALRGLLELHPRLAIRATLTDRFVRLAEENVDVAVRIGAVPEQRLTRRDLGHVQWVTVAAPSYLARHGVPAHPEQLAGHNCLSFLLPGGTLQAWHFADGPRRNNLTVRGSLVTDHGETLIDAAAAGVGIFQAHDYAVNEQLARGELVRVLSDFTAVGPALCLLFAPGKRTSPKVRAFVDCMVRLVQGQAAS